MTAVDVDGTTIASTGTDTNSKSYTNYKSCISCMSYKGCTNCKEPTAAYPARGGVSSPPAAYPALQ